MRALLFVLALAACSTTEAVDPYACVPDDLGYGCNELPPPVMDSLLTLPDSAAP